MFCRNRKRSFPLLGNNSHSLEVTLGRWRRDALNLPFFQPCNYPGCSPLRLHGGGFPGKAAPGCPAGSLLLGPRAEMETEAEVPTLSQKSTNSALLGRPALSSGTALADGCLLVEHSVPSCSCSLAFKRDACHQGDPVTPPTPTSPAPPSPLPQCSSKLCS